MIDLQKAAVYVGTYKKYNEGSLEGAWLHLNEFSTNEEFLKKCTQVHKDESEPEFMYQDTEYLPSEMYTECIIYPEVFQVLSVIRGWSEKKLNDFDEWCKINVAIPDMFDIEQFEEFYKTKPNEPKKTAKDSDFDEFLKIVESKYKNSTKKDYIGAIKVAPEKFITFDKGLFALEKSFCFGWSSFDQGDSFDKATKLCDEFNEKDFKEENLAKFDKAVCSEQELTNHIEDWGGILIDDKYWSGERKLYEMYIVSECTYRDWQWRKNKPETIMIIDTKFKQVYLNKVAELRKEFEKRIDTYLKKYGITRIKKWTYCRDD